MEATAAHKNCIKHCQHLGIHHVLFSSGCSSAAPGGCPQSDESARAVAQVYSSGVGASLETMLCGDVRFFEIWRVSKASLKFDENAIPFWVVTPGVNYKILDFLSNHS